MKTAKRYLAMAVVAVMLGSVFGFAPVSAASTYPRSETLYTANSAPPTNANPFQGGNIIGLDGLIFEPLAMLNFMTGELKPWLAESWDWVEPNVFQVKLRSGLRWQDGEPLTAEDVKFSYEYYQEIGLRDWIALGLKEIKVVDDRTVEFVFDGTPNYQLWQLQLFYGWGQGALIIPKHIFKDVDPKQIPKMTFLGDEKKYLVGSGPYKLDEVVEQQKAILVRNDDWWGNDVFGKPAPKYIIQLYVKDNSQAANMFIKGDLDVGTYYIDIVQAKKQNPNLASWLEEPPYFPPVAPVLLYFNTKKPPMDNPQFRKAIAMAINPDQIVKNGPIGGKPAEIPFGTGLLQEWADKIDLDGLVEKYGWNYGDIAEANRILDELGMKKDSNGWRTYNGKEIELHLVTCAGCSDWISAAEIIQNQLRALGIKVVIDKYDWGAMMDRYHNGEFDLGLHWSGTFQPTAYAVYNALLSEGGVANFGNYTNSEAQGVLDEFSKTTDPNKEAEYVKKLSEIWLKDVPAVPVYMATLFYEANTKYWTNWPNEKNPYGVPIFWAKYGTWGTALALLGVKPAGEAPATTTESHTTSPSQSQETTSTPSSSTNEEGGGICGPALIVGLAVVPLLLRRRR